MPVAPRAGCDALAVMLLIGPLASSFNSPFDRRAVLTTFAVQARCPVGDGMHCLAKGSATGRCGLLLLGQGLWGAGSGKKVEGLRASVGLSAAGAVDPGALGGVSHRCASISLSDLCCFAGMGTGGARSRRSKRGVQHPQSIWSPHPAGVMLYGTGWYGVTEANYSVFAVHLVTAAFGSGAWHVHPLKPLAPYLEAVLPAGAHSGGRAGRLCVRPALGGLAGA